jgi:hypothetical protein
MKFEGLTSVSTAAHSVFRETRELETAVDESIVGCFCHPSFCPQRLRAKVSRSNFIFDGERNSGVANDIFRRKNEI